MRKKDLITIALVVVISGIASFVICGQFIVKQEDKKQTAEVVSEITDSFDLPEREYINENSYNPTKTIQVAPGDNGQPFTNE